LLTLLISLFCRLDEHWGLQLRLFLQPFEDQDQELHSEPEKASNLMLMR
jgi:hypothetical protein